jgi:excisionase family DNA binding protein
MAPMKQPSASRDRLGSSLSLQQVARRWSVPRRAVRRLLQHRKLAFEQVCGQLRVPLKDVRHFEKTKVAAAGSAQTNGI